MTTTSIAPDIKLKQAEGVVAADMNGETVMMDIEKGVYFALTGTGHRIWSALESPTTPVEVIENLRGEYEIDEGDDLDTIVTEFLSNLVENGLVTPTN